MRKFVWEESRPAPVAGALIGLFVLLGVSAFAEPQPAPARGGFDGKWVIDASTSSFFCPVRSKRLTALVASGKVMGLWGLPGNPEASGAVAPDGAVTIKVRIASLDVTATIDGKIAGKTGQGAWSATSILCPNGSWRAAMND